MKYYTVASLTIVLGFAKGHPALQPCTFACPAISDASAICAVSVADPDVTRQFTANCSMTAYNCANPREKFRFEYNGKCQDNASDD
ncbi:hypothetical protein MY11210_005426 [Beauveria gryllotalpidicola]